MRIRYQCDRRFLVISAVIYIAVGVTLGLVLTTISITFGIVLGLLVVASAIIRWIIQRTYRFTVTDDTIRTEKLFTKDIDVTTPVSKVQSVSVSEGILQAILNVGTIEITTASSDGFRATFKWSHLRNPREVASRLSVRQDE